MATLSHAGVIPTPSAPQSPAERTELWHQIVRELGLKAYQRQLPIQSELLDLTDSTIVLRCEKFTLANDDKARQSLQNALDGYFSRRGEPTRQLVVKIGEAGQVQYSPQKAQAREKQDHLAQAKLTIEQHPMVQSIVREFDGMILPHSITHEP